jgi:hypothetical protein
MVETCKAAGVNIYVDGVINHMYVCYEKFHVKIYHFFGFLPTKMVSWQLASSLSEMVEMVLVLEQYRLCIRSGLNGSGTGTSGFSYSVLGLVWMVLVLELVDSHILY